MPALQRAITPSEQSILDLGKRAGVDFTPGMVKQTKPLSVAESFSGKTLTGGSTMGSRMKDIEQQTVKFRDSIQAPQGGNLNYEGGIKAAGKFKEMETLHKELTDKAYSDAWSELPAGTPIPTPNLDTLSRDIATDLSQSRLSRGDMVGVPERTMDKASMFVKKAPSEVDKLTFSGTGMEAPSTVNEMPFAPTTARGLDLDRKWLTGEISKATPTKTSPGDPFKQMTYIKMRDALDKDIAAFADQSGGKFSEKMAFARQMHGEGQGITGKIPGADILTNPHVKNIVYSEPEKMAGMVFKPKNSQLALKMRQAVGPEGYSALQDAWVENMFRNKADGFSPVKFSADWSEYSNADKKIYTAGKPDLIGKLNDLAEIGNVMRKYESQGGNPSGTGQINAAGAAIQSVITGVSYAHPVVAALELATPYGMAKLFTSKAGMGLLLKGVKLPPSSPQVAGVLTRIGGILSMQDPRDKDQVQGQQPISNDPNIDTWLDERSK